jgi:hypothetical protein
MIMSTLRFRSEGDRGRKDVSAAGGHSAPDLVIGTYLDALDLSRAIIGEDMVLEEPSRGGFVLHEVKGCRAHRIGAFSGASDAWMAIDELDDVAAGRR